MTSPRPEPAETPEHGAPSHVDQDEYEAWQDLQAVLEERDREWWAEARTSDD